MNATDTTSSTTTLSTSPTDSPQSTALTVTTPGVPDQSLLPVPVNRPGPPAVVEAPLPPSAFKRRPRTGAVAQLPKPERDMVCRMIDANVPYKRISEAVRQAGFEVHERNISNWV